MMMDEFCWDGWRVSLGVELELMRRCKGLLFSIETGEEEGRGVTMEIRGDPGYLELVVKVDSLYSTTLRSFALPVPCLSCRRTSMPSSQ